MDDYDFNLKNPHRCGALPPAATFYQKFFLRLLLKRTAAGSAPSRIIPLRQSHR